jgi:hypothetical protein
MRHPHGLRAAADVDTGLAIGDAYEGGFFAGYISHTANSVATHALIVAPRATGASGTGYTLTTMLLGKTSDTPTAGTSSDFNGAINSANMNNADHPAAQFCENLSIGGYSDWYLPARYELDIAYENLKPNTNLNSSLYGINPYSVPARTVNRASGVPARTPLAAFQTGGAEAFVADIHWSSTEQEADPVTDLWRLSFSAGVLEGSRKSTQGRRVRAFRKVAL